MCKSAIIQYKMPIFTFYLLWNSLWKTLIIFVDNRFLCGQLFNKKQFLKFCRFRMHRLIRTYLLYNIFNNKSIKFRHKNDILTMLDYNFENMRKMSERYPHFHRLSTWITVYKFGKCDLMQIYLYACNRF